MEEHRVPRVDVLALLTERFPPKGAVTVLNIDIEGVSLTALRHVDLQRFPFDVVLIEVDVPETASSGESEIHVIDGYALAAVLGPTLAYRRDDLARERTGNTPD